VTRGKLLTKTQILDHLAAIFNEHGVISANDYDKLYKNGEFNRKTVYRHFGPWFKAVTEVYRYAMGQARAAEVALETRDRDRILFEGRFNIVSLGDWHVPFHDAKSLKGAFDWCKKVQPDILVLHELHDFYAISRFDKNPNRQASLQDEIDIVTGYLTELRGLCPASRMILLESNHSDRLRRYLWSKAPALACLRVLEIEGLLELQKNSIEYMEYFIHQKFLFKHGDVVSKESGMTARRELAREGMSGVSGHTHRLGAHYRRNRGGEYVWLENGCICDLNPEYIKGTADWQQGFSLVSFESRTKKTFFATNVPLVNHEVTL
jgi:hypothetical protein